MSNFNKATKAVIPTPATLTEESFNNIVASATTHYAELLTPELLISNRRGCYATVINSTYDNKPLEQVVGSANAKVATEMILSGVTSSFSAIPVR